MSKHKFNTEFEGKRQLNLIVDGKTVTCETDTATDIAYLTYVAGTNGLHGGDAGHGARAVLTLFGHEGFSMGTRTSKLHSVAGFRSFESMLRDAENVEEIDTDIAVSVVVEGDSEIECFADALIKAGEALQRQIEESKKAKV